ncbi:MAG: hypothetical protein AAB551_04210, partial [Patescibacteria group bacterium]
MTLQQTPRDGGSERDLLGRQSRERSNFSLKRIGAIAAIVVAGVLAVIGGKRFVVDPILEARAEHDAMWKNSERVAHEYSEGIDRMWGQIEEAKKSMLLVSEGIV